MPRFCGMPVVFRHDPYRVFFYSNEGNPREPVHVHVATPDGQAKIAFDPVPHVVRSTGLHSATLRDIVRVVTRHASLIEETWNDYFG